MEPGFHISFVLRDKEAGVHIPPKPPKAPTPAPAGKAALPQRHEQAQVPSVEVVPVPAAMLATDEATETAEETVP